MKATCNIISVVLLLSVQLWVQQHVGFFHQHHTHYHAEAHHQDHDHGHHTHEHGEGHAHADHAHDHSNSEQPHEPHSDAEHKLPTFLKQQLSFNLVTQPRMEPIVWTMQASQGWVVVGAQFVPSKSLKQAISPRGPPCRSVV